MAITPTLRFQQQGEEIKNKFAVGVDENVVGPVRSGRLPYEYIRKLYNGFIVMASAYSKVAAQLKDFVNVYSDDNMDTKQRAYAGGYAGRSGKSQPESPWKNEPRRNGF